MIRSIDTACYMDKKKGKMGSRVKKKDIHQKHQFYFNENIVILVFASGSIPFLVIRCVKVSTDKVVGTRNKLFEWFFRDNSDRSHSHPFPFLGSQVHLFWFWKKEFHLLFIGSK